ncbi:MAG TPA: hypothetical protein VMT71_01970 [Syntrophorhabdales bacterium]|nr:hypothetical protein [Syntrophorhabdales bacterium]
MEMILNALRDSLWLTVKLLLIILPLTISYEFLKERGLFRGTKPFFFVGITRPGLLPLVTGVIIGLTYGAGVIIHAIKEHKLGKREVFLILLFLSVCHAIFEDTLLFVVIGANGLIVVVARLILAAVFTYLAYRSRLFEG